MKKNKGLILILVLLLAATAYFVINRGKGTIDKELSNFSFSDTAAITKIFLADRTGASVTLLRKSAGEWELADGSEVRSDAMNNLLACIKDVGVRSPVANAAYNNVVKAIATKGIKVEIYTDKGPVKTYYVGGPTQDQMGTFMHLEGSSRPFVTQIPGFNGYLTPRYITKVADWKTKRIFRLKPSEIKTVTAVDKSVEGAAVRIESDGKDGFLLFNAKGEAVAGASQDKIFSYLEFYGSINYESDEKSLSSFQRDSLLASEPFREVFVEDKGGRKKLIKLWKRPQTPTTQNKTNASGEPFPYDIDRMTARLEGDTALIVVQYYMFDKLFRRPAEFVVKP